MAREQKLRKMSKRIILPKIKFKVDRNNRISCTCEYCKMMEAQRAFLEAQKEIAKQERKQMQCSSDEEADDDFYESIDAATQTLDYDADKENIPPKDKLEEKKTDRVVKI